MTFCENPSANDPKRTSLVAPHMSAFGSKADMTIALKNVCVAERRQHDLAVAARVVTGGSLNFGPGRGGTCCYRRTRTQTEMNRAGD
jgi:hypothetical protein